MAVSATNIEYEYKWRIDGLVGNVASDALHLLDPLLLEITEKGCTALGATHRELFTFVQASLQFDTQDWALADAGLSFAALINYGALAGSGWLVLKETVRWFGCRREALEVAEAIVAAEVSSRLRDPACVPVDRLHHRLPSRDLDLRPFATVVQRRRKLIAELPEGFELAVTLDSSRWSPVETSEPSTAWWVEVEVNSGDTRALAGLDSFATQTSAVLRREPDHGTKPQLFAAAAGWSG